jgi:mevalonate kinase
MTSSWQLEVKMKAKIFCDRKINLGKVTMKYGGLVVFIRHDSAEIWGFRYALALVIGALKIMASTGVFVRVVCTFKHSIKNFVF